MGAIIFRSNDRPCEQELEEAVANATPPPVDGAAVKGKGKAKGRPGAAVVARVLGKDPSPGEAELANIRSVVLRMSVSLCLLIGCCILIYTHLL